MVFGLFTLLVALVISGVAAYYSIVGLTAIFSAAVIPIIIMGASLEVGKVTAAVWLKINWHRASITYKLYLVPAVALLMLLTSMGIFGFLSKAHSDQSLVSGDSTAKVAIYDEKIKTEKENIEANRKALKQMDEGVDQVLGRSTDEKGADKAVNLRRSQQKERTRLQTEILQSQKLIAELNDARAPLAAEVRKVEAEVGPIKYIAALIYGDNPDANILERAVRWVIIVIVAVFDPLALVLILAAQQSLRWAREEYEQKLLETPVAVPVPLEPKPETLIQPASKSEEKLRTDPFVPGWPFPVARPPEGPTLNPQYEPDDGPLTDNQIEQIKESVEETKILDASVDVVDRPGDYVTPPVEDDDADPAVKAAMKRWKNENPDDTLKYQRQLYDAGKINELPWAKYIGLTADNKEQVGVIGFGTQFPVPAVKGDMFLRVDRIPSVLFKYNGTRWIEVDKSLSDQYAYDDAYIEHLISKIDSGEYDPELLNDIEREQIALKLNQKDINGNNT